MTIVSAKTTCPMYCTGHVHSKATSEKAVKHWQKSPLVVSMLAATVSSPLPPMASDV